MEDALYYIVLGVIMVISLVGKTRKKAHKIEEERPNTSPIPPAEAFERAIRDLQQTAQERVESRPTPKTMPQSTIMQPQRVEYTCTEEAQSLETIIDEVALATEFTSTSTTNPQQTLKKAYKTTDQPAVANNTPQQPIAAEDNIADNEHNDESTFNLREAVICSEILKPKFEE